MHKDCVIIFVFFVFIQFSFFLHLLCISLVPLIVPYSAQILLENSLLCRQNALLKNRLLCSKCCLQNLSKRNFEIQINGREKVISIRVPYPLNCLSF